ncbi:tetratricopeptide repeat protein [Clostridium senegalense]
MKKNKTIIMLSVIICTLFLLVGCKPSGNPKNVLNDYYTDIKEGNAEKAYGKLSQKSKDNFKKEDFIKWVEVGNESSTLNNVEIEENKNFNKKSVDDIKFKNIYEFNVKENINDLLEDKEKVIESIRYVVNENNEWKIYRGEETGKQNVSKELAVLGSMYSDGKGGKEKDLNKAVSLFNEALENDPGYKEVYYSLSYSYFMLGRYDEATKAIDTYLGKEETKEGKSLGYNMLGLIYENTNRIEKAKEYYKQAVKFDDKNEYAKTNLAKFE